MIIVIAIKIFVVSPFIVSGESMKMSLDERDVLFAVKKPFVMFFTFFNEERFNGYLKGRVVVIENDGECLLKRCVGTEGDTLLFFDAVKSDTFIVPNDSIFVIGDNFRRSRDSRSFGFISTKKIVGVGINKINTPFEIL